MRFGNIQGNSHFFFVLYSSHLFSKNPQIEAQIQNLLAVRDRYTNSAYLKKTHDQVNA